MRVVVGLDHSGYHLKQTLMTRLCAGNVEHDDVNVLAVAHSSAPAGRRLLSL